MMRNYLIILLLTLAILTPRTDSFAEEMITWRECVAGSLNNHPDLQSAREKMKQADANVGIARSGLFPLIDASSSLSRVKSAAENRATPSYSVGISGKQLLFDSGKTFYDLKNRQRLAEAKKYEYDQSSATIRRDLRYAFVNLLNAQGLVSLGREIESIRKRNLDLVRMRYRSGLEHRGSLLTAEANLAQAEYEVSQAGRSVELYRRSLAENMGLRSIRPYRAEEAQIAADSYASKPDLEALADVHPKLKGVIQQRIAAEFALSSSKLDYSPKMYGVASANREGGTWPLKNENYSIGVQISLNLFQGGRSYYQTSLNDAEYRQLLADERSTRNTLMLGLEEAWTNLKNAIDTVNVRQKYLKAAEERASIANAQYSIGTIQFDSWTIIQDNLVSAKKSYLEARTRALLSESDWNHATGRTLNYDQ